MKIPALRLAAIMFDNRVCAETLEGRFTGAILRGRKIQFRLDGDRTTQEYSEMEEIEVNDWSLPGDPA
jgi:hypothetical protein